MVVVKGGPGSVQATRQRQRACSREGKKSISVSVATTLPSKPPDHIRYDRAGFPSNPVSRRTVGIQVAV